VQTPPKLYKHHEFSRGKRGVGAVGGTGKLAVGS